MDISLIDFNIPINKNTSDKIPFGIPFDVVKSGLTTDMKIYEQREGSKSEITRFIPLYHKSGKKDFTVYTFNKKYTPCPTTYVIPFRV